MSVATDTAQNFDFGRVTSQIGGLIGRNFVPFFVLALLFSGLPSVILYFVQPMIIANPMSAGAASAGVLWMVVTVLITLLLAFVLQAALTRASIDDLSGKAVSISAALEVGLRCLFPLFALAIVVGLGVMVGALLLVVPGIILAICWMVSSPVLVVEKTGVFQAMQRSLALTRGHRWALFGILVLYVVVVWIISVVVFLLASGGAAGGMPTLAAFRPSFGMSIVTAIIQSFEVLLSTVGIAAIYFELRRIKEGVGVADLASVFD